MSKLNLLGFLCEAWGYNTKIYKDIDKLYDKYKYECYKLAKKNEWYNHPLLNDGNLIQVEYRKKALGIILYSQKYADDMKFKKQFSDIVEKGWSFVCNYIISHNKITISDFVKYFIKKRKGLSNITDDELNSYIVTLVSITSSFDKEIDLTDKAYNLFYNNIMLRLQHYENNDITRLSLKTISEEDKAKLFDLKKQLLNKIYKESIKRRIKLHLKNSNISTKEEEMLRSMLTIRDYNEEQIKENMKFLNVPKIKNYTTFLDNLHETSYGIGISFLYDLHNLTESILNYIDFSEQEVDEIIYAYIAANNILRKEINVNDLYNFFISSFYIKGMIKSYNQVKQHYFKNNKETMYIEMEELEDKIQELKNQNKIYEISDKMLKDKLSKTEQKVEKLENKLRQEKEKYEEKLKNIELELNSLREFMFRLDTQIEYKYSDNIDLNKLKQVKGVIIGGHDKWQQRMKELLPGFIFIHTDMINFDTNILNNVDCVFFYVNYLNHSIYYKVIEHLRNREIKFGYLNQANEELVLKEISRLLEE